MAVVAVRRLPGAPLDVVRGGPLPGRDVAEVGEAILAVEVEHRRVGGHVADQHVPVSGSRSLEVVVQTDLEGLHFPPVLEERHPLAVLSHVAAVAVDVGLGVTHLALHLADMEGVVPHGAVLQVLVAVGATHHLLQVVPALEVLGRSGMHFLGLMAGDAVHGGLCRMDVPPAALSVELAAHAAAVAGGALVDGVGALLEYMPVDETLPGELGRLTWQPPQLVWQAAQWFFRASSICPHLSLFARLLSTLGNMERVACSESLAVATISSWHSPQAFWGLLTDGEGVQPLWAAALSMLAGLPPWQLSQSISPCAVDKEILGDKNLLCGSNGATGPPQPLPDCIADFLAWLR